MQAYSTTAPTRTLCIGIVVCLLVPGNLLSAESNWEKCPPGPWGDLEYRWFCLDPPSQAIESIRFTKEPAEWRFTGMTVPAITNLFATAQLRAAQWPELSPSHWEATDEGTVVHPTLKLIAAMDSPQRTRVYSVLARSNDNPSQYRPWSIVPKGRVAAWVQDSKLSAETQSLVKQLIYEHNGAVAFADAQVVLSRTDDKERQDFLAWLLSNPVVSVRMRLTQLSDLRSLADYWASYGTSVHVLPLLESSIRGQEEVYIDIINLLPAFAKQRLNRYSIGVLANEGGDPPDCFWSAINFLREDVERDPFAGGFAHYFQRHYHTVKSREFGDVILWVDGQKRVPHAAVFVAGNIVFTKNGGEPRRPWQLSTLDDVKARYRGDLRLMRQNPPG